MRLTIQHDAIILHVIRCMLVIQCKVWYRPWWFFKREKPYITKVNFIQGICYNYTK